jgi:hypothetical protein
MNILDENIPEHQRLLLRSWRVPVRQIGRELGNTGMSDDAIVTLLHHVSRPTFFTRDDGFYHSALCQPNYCLVYLAVGQHEVASFVRRFLRHPLFATQTRRRGAVVRVSHSALRAWRFRQTAEEVSSWSEQVT